MKIYDCFTYFNESELLRIRLEELTDVVDYFVIVEASQTFTGEPKPFYLDDLDWLELWHDQIIRVQVNFPKTMTSAWDREIHQREAINIGIFEPDDRVLISDVDEIPRAKIVKTMPSALLPARLDVTQYFWSCHWQVPQHCNQGARPVLCLGKHLQEYTPQQLREHEWGLIEDAGWHFSFFGGVDKIRHKIESFAHTEFDTEEYKDYQKILQRIEDGIDPFDRFPLKYCEIDDSFPKAMRSTI